MSSSTTVEQAARTPALASRVSDQSANRPRLIWIAVGLAILALVVGMAALFVPSPGGGVVLTSLPAVDRRIVRAVALDEHTVMAATTTNTLFVSRDGEITSEVPLPFLVNAMAALPGGNTAVGLVTGEVQVFDDHLQAGLSMKLPGRIAGLASHSDGGLTITYGSGPSASDYKVEHYDASGNLLSSAVVGAPTRGVALLGDLAIFANARGEVGAVNSQGQVVWRELTQQPLNAVAGASDAEAVFTADTRGGIGRLAADGSSVWYVTVTEYQLITLYALHDGSAVVAGAEDGSVFALDSDGTVKFSQRLTDARIEAVAPTKAGAVAAVAANGKQFALNLLALESGSRLGQLRTGSYVGTGLLVVAALATGLAGFGRSRVALKRTGRRVYRARLGYALIAPAMVLMLVFTYYPALSALYIAFTDFSLSAPAEFVGLRNFLLMPRDPFLVAGVKNMLILLVTNVVKSVTVPLLVAELVFWLRSERLKSIFRTAFVFPAVVPGIVAILFWKTIWAPRIGLVNQILQLVGLGQYQRAWLGGDSTALLAVIMTGFPWVEIFAFLVFFGGLLAVSSEIFDAAAVDGASWLTRFWNIDVPALTPQFSLVLFFTFIGSIQSFAGIFVLTGGGPGTATFVPALQMYRMISIAAEFGYASAIGFVLAAVVVVLVLLRLRFVPLEDESDGSFG